MDTTQIFISMLSGTAQKSSQTERFLDLMENCSRNHGFTVPIEFQPDHPVEEVGR